MNTIHEYGKWYDASEPPEPQFNGSIYFITKDGNKYAGTYKGYSIFLSLDEEQFHARDIDRWIIRDRKPEPSKREYFTYKNRNIVVEARQDIGFHWRASFQNGDSETYVNKEAKQEAIDAMKKIINDFEK